MAGMSSYARLSETAHLCMLSLLVLSLLTAFALFSWHYPSQTGLNYGTMTSTRDDGVVFAYISGGVYNCITPQGVYHYAKWGRFVPYRESVRK